MKWVVSTIEGRKIQEIVILPLEAMKVMHDSLENDLFYECPYEIRIHVLDQPSGFIYVKNFIKEKYSYEKTFEKRMHLGETLKVRYELEVENEDMNYILDYYRKQRSKESTI